MQIQDLLQKWAHMDTQLKQANEKIRKYREYKQDLSNQIFKHINDARNKHTNTTTPIGDDTEDDDDDADDFVPALLTIQSTGTRIQLFERIEYASITFGYLEECLSEVIPEEDHVSYILDFIRNNRKVRRIPEIKQLQPPHATAQPPKAK